MVVSVGRALRVRSEFRRTIGVIYDSRYFHNDWFSELLVLAICADGVDTGRTAQARR
jgi:hypothetical protein